MTIEERLTAALHALEFYAEPLRYVGSNQNPIPNDPFQPRDLIYRLDVLRDGGRIASEALRSLT